MIGLLQDAPPDWAEGPDVDLSGFASLLADAREAAMASKDFAEVDRIKSALIDAGVEVRMSKSGVSAARAIWRASA